MIPPIKETAKKKRQLMKQVINENDKKRNHQYDKKRNGKFQIQNFGNW